MDYTTEELRFLTLIGQVVSGAASAAPAKAAAPVAEPVTPSTDTTKAEA
jgi:hypothetical protein